MILMHQIDKLKETYKDDNVTIHFIDSDYSPAIGHTHISGSSYPLDYNPKTGDFFVACKVLNKSINQNLFDDHKKYIVAFIKTYKDSIINPDSHLKLYYPTMKNPFNNNHLYLINYLTMQILLDVSKKGLLNEKD